MRHTDSQGTEMRSDLEWSLLEAQKTHPWTQEGAIVILNEKLLT